MLNNPILTMSLLVCNQLLDAFFFFLNITKGHDFTVRLALSFDISVRVRSERVGPCGSQRPAVEAALLIIRLSVGNPGRFLTAD